MKAARGLSVAFGRVSAGTLHKLRRMFCATLLGDGLDLSTVQRFMGHADLASTMHYLRPAVGTESQAKINSIV